MKIAPLPPDEEERLAALEEYQILDTEAETVFDKITTIASQICGVPISLISLIDRDRQWFKSKVGLSNNESSRDTAFCAHAILDSNLMEVPDATKDDRFHDNPFVTHDPNIKFYAGMPLINPRGFKLGTLCVIDREPKELTEAQRDSLKNLSEIVISFFEIKKAILSDINQRKIASEALREANAKLKKKLSEQKQSRQELLLLSEMSSVLQACMVADEAYVAITKFCNRLFANTKGTLFLLNTKHDHIERVAGWGDSPQEDFFNLDSCWALRRNQMHYVTNRQQDLVCEHMKKNTDNLSYLCVPLMAQGEIIGLLTLELFNQIFTESQRLLANAAGEQSALALANVKLRESLHQQSVRDPLTGLYNRRYLVDLLKHNFLRLEKKQLSMAFLIIDIDHFKKFNDTYGHDAGDLVLRHVAKLLMRIAKNNHSEVFRFGGEEFIIIVEDVTIDEARIFAENIREKIQQETLNYNGITLPNITFSIGVALYPQHGKTLDELLLTADSALYKAKQSGRNRIILVSEIN